MFIKSDICDKNCQKTSKIEVNVEDKDLDIKGGRSELFSLIRTSPGSRLDKRLTQDVEYTPEMMMKKLEYGCNESGPGGCSDPGMEPGSTIYSFDLLN